MLLASTGHGDLVVVQEAPGGGMSQTQPILPLRPAPPLQGVRPFQLLAACQLSCGDVLAIAWAVRQRADSKPAVCEVFALTLVPPPGQGTAGSAWSGQPFGVGEVQLLQSATLPPYAAMCNPATGGVLLALDPAEDEAGAAAAETVNFATHAAGEGIARFPGSTAFPRELEEKEDDVSPRTLQAAVERLAHLTSEEVSGAFIYTYSWDPVQW